MPIIDLQRRLVEVGRLRMGQKGDRGQPQKLDTWRLTSRDKTRLEAAAALYGGDVRAWTERPGEFELITTTAELPILLLPGQTISLWYELWSGGGNQRRCDGERMAEDDSPCRCAQEDGDRKCKPTTRLSVMLPDVPGLGCWRAESHGWYAAVELSATAAMLERATALGQLLPARLRIDQRRKVEGGKTTRYAVPVIDIDTTPRHALSIGQSDEPKGLAYTPAARELFATTVAEGLVGAEQTAEPKAITARSAAPIPDGDKIEFGDPVPVDPENGRAGFGERPALPGEESSGEPAVSDSAEEGPSSPTPPERVPDAQDPGMGAGTPDPITDKQKKKLDVLVGTLRDAGHITTEQLWKACGHVPELSGDENGELHWSPLRDQLSKDQASELIDRLERYEANLTYSGGSEFARMAEQAQRGTAA